MKRGFAAAMVMALLAGCATTSGNKIDPATISTFQPGVTTIAQVEAALGQPFQSTRMPDGSQQLQYVSKVQNVSGDGMPTTGSEIPKHTSTMVSTMLSFDQAGHFVRSWSNSKTNNNNWPSNLGNMQSGDIPVRNAGAAH
jgi:outer membrane protein assembly factor BamE (lipoprotein component of BamABCDE complex)